MDSKNRIYFGMITTWNAEKRIGFLSYNTAGRLPEGKRYKDHEAFFSKSQVVPDNGSKRWPVRNCPVFFQLEKSVDGNLKDLAVNVTNAFGSGE